MAKGSAEPTPARTPTVPFGGIRVIAEVVMQMNKIIELEATPRMGLSFASSLIAFRPKGVAAFDRPKMLAVKLMMIAPMAGWSSGTSGKRRRVSGASRCAIQRIIPASLPICIRPSTKIMMPVRLITSWTELFALSSICVLTACMRDWSSTTSPSGVWRTISTSPAKAA